MVVPGPIGRPGRSGRARRVRERIAPYALALPAALLVAVFAYGVLGGMLQGLGVMPFLGMDTPTLDYYRQALTRPDLLSSIGYSVYLALVSAAVALVGASSSPLRSCARAADASRASWGCRSPS